MTNTATKTKLILFFLTFYGTLFSQDPYLSDVSGNGIGQYGYCEESASTFHLIESNTHGVQGLAARWWDGSSEYVYYTGVGAMPCQTKSLITIDYVNSNHHDWSVGDIAYVSVLAQGCGGSWNPCFNGCAGYNERQFKKIDVKFQWNASDEGNDVIRSTTYAAIYHNGSWTASGMTGLSGSNPYTRTVNNVNDFTYFAISDADATITNTNDLPTAIEFYAMRW